MSKYHYTYKVTLLKGSKKNCYYYGKHIKDMMSEETYKNRNEKISLSRRNTICINNGIIQKYVKEDVLQSFLDNGFVLGKLKKYVA